MVLLEIHQRFEGHFLNELRVSFQHKKKTFEISKLLKFVPISTLTSSDFLIQRIP